MGAERLSLQGTESIELIRRGGAGLNCKQSHHERTSARASVAL